MTDSEEEEEENEIIPHKDTDNIPEYIPTPKSLTDLNNQSQQKFVVTLDGIEKVRFKNVIEENLSEKPSIKSRLDKKRVTSPIIFEKEEPAQSPEKNMSKIPDKLPLVRAPPSVKNKERCRYWPSCKQGDKCEFVHPSMNCERFPHCKFGAKCVYLHPKCKFGSSCTRKDCIYNHIVGKFCRFFNNIMFETFFFRYKGY